MKRISLAKLEALKNKNVGNILIADLRSPVLFAARKVKDSVNLPLKNFINRIMGLPKNTVIVIFSTNINDQDLVSAYNYAVQLGFEKVYGAEFLDLIGEK